MESYNTRSRNEMEEMRHQMRQMAERKETGYETPEMRDKYDDFVRTITETFKENWEW